MRSLTQIAEASGPPTAWAADVCHWWANGGTIITFTSGKTTMAHWWQNANALAVVNVSGSLVAKCLWPSSGKMLVAQQWQNTSGPLVDKDWWPTSGKGAEATGRLLHGGPLDKPRWGPLTSAIWVCFTH